MAKSTTNTTPSLGSRSNHSARSLTREIPVGQSSSFPALGSRSNHGAARGLPSRELPVGQAPSSPALGSRSIHGARSLAREIPGQVPSSPALGSRSNRGSARSLRSRELPEGASASGGSSLKTRSNSGSGSHRVGSNNGSHLSLKLNSEALHTIASEDFTPARDETFYYLKAAIHVYPILIYERHGLRTELGDEKFVQHGSQLGYHSADYEFPLGLEKGKLASYQKQLSRRLKNGIEEQKINASPSTSTWKIALPNKYMIPLTAGGTLGGLAITAAGLAGISAGAFTATAIISGAVAFVIYRKLKANRDKANAKLINKYLTDEACDIICEMVIALLVQHTTRRIQDLLATNFSINLCTNPVELLNLVKQLTSNELRKQSTGNYSAEMKLIEGEAEKDAEKLIEYLIKYEKNYEKDPKKYSCSSDYIELLIPDFSFQHQRNGDIHLVNLRKNLVAWLSALVNTIKKHPVEYQQNFKEDLKLLKQERTFALYCLQAQHFANDTEMVVNDCIADRDLDEADPNIKITINLKTVADADAYLEIAETSLESAKAIATTFPNSTHIENILNKTEGEVKYAVEAVDLLKKRGMASDSTTNRDKFLKDSLQVAEELPAAPRSAMSCNALFFRSAQSKSSPSEAKDLMNFSPTVSESGSRARASKP